MSVARVISSALKGNLAFVTVLGSEKVYIGTAPQNAALPYVVFNPIGSQHEYHAGANSQLLRSSVQVDIYAATMSVVDDLRNKAKAIFEGTWDSLLGESPYAIDVRSAMLQDQSFSTERYDDGSERVFYRVRMDWDFWHREAV